ncbi:hypothetical protein ALQ86_03118 [Pseudomonas amygdali pv. eriobotryae]|uniref:Uncharacterized protein n=1 Tax=Pseudomonas amygdali pv. eriobotryae TaxID=129137 RepID=A0A3M3A7H6_PSEA0|nr:hypothetical protein ALQ86_03118 [Pseudomonas amygdali pv. eriobotryae]
MARVYRIGSVVAAATETLFDREGPDEVEPETGAKGLARFGPSK